MNDLFDFAPAHASAPAMTMTSREIAELSGKEHKNVLADIRKMLEDLGQRSADFSADLPDGYGRPQAAFKLPKRETLILVSGYSVAMRARIIDRWQQLEDEAAAPKVPQTLPEALRLAADLADQKAKAEAALALAAPKAAALDRIETVSDGSFCLRDAAKLLQVPERQFIQKLHKKNYIYPQEGAGWRAYSERLKDGLLEHKITTGQKADGSEWKSTQVRVTARGLARLSLMLENERGQH